MTVLAKSTKAPVIPWDFNQSTTVASLPGTVCNLCQLCVGRSNNLAYLVFFTDIVCVCMYMVHGVCVCVCVRARACVRVCVWYSPR